MAKFFISLKYR